MALSTVAQSLAKLSEADLKVKLAELAKYMPDIAKDVEKELADNSERIARERKLNEKRNKTELDAAAFAPIVPALSKVKLDGLKVAIDITSMTLNADGSLGDVTVKLTSDSLQAVVDGVTSRIGAVLVGKAPGRTLKVQAVNGAWTLIEEPTKTVSSKGTGTGTGSRGNKRLTLDGTDYASGTAAAKVLGVEIGKGSAWVAIFASKNGDALKQHGAKFYGSRDGIEKLLVAQVQAGNVVIVNEDGSAAE